MLVCWGCFYHEMLTACRLKESKIGREGREREGQQAVNVSCFDSLYYVFLYPNHLVTLTFYPGTLYLDLDHLSLAFNKSNVLWLVRLQVLHIFEK